MCYFKYAAQAVWAFAGGIAPVAGDVSVGDDSHQADAAFPFLPFCAGFKENKPKPLKNHHH